jgi:hypothetical protein
MLYGLSIAFLSINPSIQALL